MKGKFLFLFVLPLLIGISTLGIFLIEGSGDSPYTSLFNSLWWTVVTFTTVGYGDMAPVTVSGRIFGILILATGVLINSIIISMVSNWFFSLKSGREQGLKPVKSNDQILICSDSPVFIYSVLTENVKFVRDHKAVIITPLEKHPLAGSPYEKIPWVHGDAYRLDVLKMASANEAKIAYVSYKDDADTVMVVMQLEVFSPGGRIQTMARYQIQDFYAHLCNVGCDYAIKTFDVYVPLMIQAYTAQGVPVWLREIILRLSNTATIKSKQIGPGTEGQTWLEHISFAKETLGEMPLGLADSTNTVTVNPPADFKLTAEHRLITVMPHSDGPSGDFLSDAVPLIGYEATPQEGHILVCSDEAPFISRILDELDLANELGQIVVLSKLTPFHDKKDQANLSWIQAKSFSDFGLTAADASNARVAFIDHERDSHTLMAVLRLETITDGKVFSIASYREPDFDNRLLEVGCDYCINVDELIAPILSQNAVHPGIGKLLEEIISHQGHTQSLFVKSLSEKWQPTTWLDVVVKLKKESGYLPVGLIPKSGEGLLINPAAKVVVNQQDTLILLASAETTFDPQWLEKPVLD